MSQFDILLWIVAGISAIASLVNVAKKIRKNSSEARERFQQKLETEFEAARGLGDGAFGAGAERGFGAFGAGAERGAGAGSGHGFGAFGAGAGASGVFEAGAERGLGAGAEHGFRAGAGSKADSSAVGAAWAAAFGLDGDSWVDRSERLVSDTQSLETEYDAMDGRAPRAGSDGYGAPAGRAGQDESAKRFGSAVAADHFEAGIDAYEKLARERSLERSLDRSRQKTADTAITAVNNTPANVAAEGENRPVLPDILGDEFDLRRAVIEAEILTPKYL